MFNNDVTQTYNLEDASQEIIIMLLGAFLLGYLLCWLVKTFLGENKYTTENNSDKLQVQGLDEVKPIPQTTNAVRVAGNPNNRTPGTDDLTKIRGINLTVQTALKKEGINSFIDLRDINTTTLKTIQNNQISNKKEIETWPHQASLAAKGDWKKLSEYQSFIEQAQIALKDTRQIKPKNADNLKLIEGIGPKIKEILNNKEIYTFKQLNNIDSITLKKYIVDADKRFENNNTESWPHQAGMAEKEQWDELNIYQEFMRSDPKPAISIKSSTSNIMTEEHHINQNDHDDLKKIEGIGSKVEEILNNNGIYTFRQLYNSDRKRLKRLLEAADKQFKIHDPESWPHQAGMADRADWKVLKIYQEIINKDRQIPSTSSSLVSETSPSKVSSNIFNKNDDLKKIEGIGPKIEELLNNLGINSFQKLSNSSRDVLKTFLDEAGPQYQRHEPKSWPHQAKLAAAGKWKKLKEYQDYLIDGHG